jgi:hypothetical protein
MTRNSVGDRLMARMEIDPITGCWNWSGCKHDSRGYGYMTVDGKQYYTHRLAAYAFLGMDLEDDEQQANHECDNPPCIRTGDGHIYVGTQKQNLQEMMLKGRDNRTNNVRGEQHGRSILTVDRVILVRELRSQGAKLEDIANIVGVKRGSIPDILARRTWAHV